MPKGQEGARADHTSLASIVAVHCTEVLKLLWRKPGTCWWLPS